MIGLSLFDVAALNASKHWGVAIGSVTYNCSTNSLSLCSQDDSADGAVLAVPGEGLDTRAEVL